MSDDLRIHMNEFDIAHWDEIQRWKDVRMRPIRLQIISQHVRSAVLAPLGRAMSVACRVSGGEALTRTASSAALGLVGLAVSASEVSVRRKRILRAYRSAGSDVRTPQDVHSLTLDNVLTVRPRLSLTYSTTAVARGVMSDVLASGGSVAAIPGMGMASAPRVGVTASAIATDITGFLAVATHLVAHTAVYYGYDPEDPIERFFSTMMLSQAIGPTGSGHGFVVEEQMMMLTFDKVTRDPVRHGSLDDLGNDVVVSAISSLFSVVGVRLASRKLAQIVPVTGVTVDAGLNTALMRTIGETANHLYRRRFLAECYGRVEPDDGTSTDLVRPTDTQELDADIACYIEIAEAKSRP